MEYKSDAKWHPQSLDVRAFSRDGATLSGQAPLAQWERLSAESEDGLVSPPVKWQARGEAVPEVGAQDQVWLHLQVNAVLPLLCQRCLSPLLTAVDVDRSFRFVADEATAMALDDEEEEDLLVTSREFNLIDLVEDEVILAMPLVPLHEACPEPLHMSVEDPQCEQEEQKRPHPFAALAGLKLKKSS
ncbi:YceD family protein [Limnohabitans sp. Rim8]|uniref:YceD family protein n=1 Tax=Limnohabitans sp. Rim8 TaxID=1100718 RepID=UPI0033058A30